jgi:hypothetical protein
VWIFTPKVMTMKLSACYLTHNIPVGASWPGFFFEKRCHPEPFLSHANKTKTPPLYSQSTKKNAVILSPFYSATTPSRHHHSQNTNKNAVILSPFYPTRATLNASTKPSGDKKGEGSSRAFTSCKRLCVIKEHVLLGPRG